MHINENTKISALINHNIQAIDAIAAINPHFKKLKNPILRKVLAPRVTIADAARIGKCSVQEFFNALEKIGFIAETTSTKTQVEEKTISPSFLKSIEDKRVITFDVRSILAEGTDPFQQIMQQINQLPEDFTLEIINTFEPTPLIKILTNKGFESMVKTTDDVVTTWFYKPKNQQNTENKIVSESCIKKVSLEELTIQQQKWGTNCKEIDVRDLEMPLPMVTILNEVAKLMEHEAIFVHHKKVPQYLIPELEERNCHLYICEIEEGNVKLLIHK